MITTRRGGFRQLGAVLDLDVLPRDQAVALLRRRAPTLSSEQAGELAELLGDLPLALEQAAGYLDQTHLPAQEYLDLLRTRAPDMLSRGRLLDHTETIASLWSLTVQRLRGMAPAAVQLADVCAFLAPEPIPLDLLTAHPDVLPHPLCVVVGDRVAVADVVGVLVDYSLAQRTSTGLLFHRLTQTVLRHSTSTAPSLPVTALALLRADLPGRIEEDPQSWPRWRQLLPHVLAATSHHPDSTPVAAGDTAWLLDHAAAYQQTHGQPAQAQPLYERSLHIVEASYSPDHPDVAASLNNLAQVLRDLGQPAQSQPLLERAWRIYEASYGPDHPDVAASLNNLAWVLGDLGQAAQAQPLVERALRILEASYGPDHPYVATSLTNLARVLHALGQPAQALPLLKRALHIREARYGPDHPVTRRSQELLRLLENDQE